MKNLLFSLILFTCFGCLLGCTSEQNKSGNSNQQDMIVTHSDSTLIQLKIKEYFDYIKNSKVDSALDLVYTVIANRMDAMPVKLDEDEKKDLRFMFKTFPVYDFTIDYMTFVNECTTEVRCSVLVTDPATDQKPRYHAIYFKPVRYWGEWYLCLKDSEYGDH